MNVLRAYKKDDEDGKLLEKVERCLSAFIYEPGSLSGLPGSVGV